MDFEFLGQHLALAGLGLVAGLINTVAGGGSALTIPALMLLGLPGNAANATNRVSVFTQSLTGSAKFRQAGLFAGVPLVAITALTVLGALLGALCAVWLPNDVFEPVILVCMIGVAVLIALRPEFGKGGEAPRMIGEAPGAALGLFASGFYGGFLQAGVGYMLLAALCGGLRYDLAAGNAIKVFVVVIFTLPALLVFHISGLIDWHYVLPLVIGTSAGAWIAAHYASRVDPAKLRRVLLVCVTAMCGLLAYRIF